VPRCTLVEGGERQARIGALDSTKSYPFEPPASGKIAVKVIDDYGDEVVKVYKV
jgi:hypothetical protein